MDKKDLVSQDLFRDDDDENNDVFSQDKPEHEFIKINPYLAHTEMKYGKKFYWGEFLAEKSIKFIAFMSIGIILAIFIYVFKESVFAFQSPEITHQTETSHVSNNNNASSPELKPETYSPGGSESAELKPETYSPGGSDSSATQSGNQSQETTSNLEKGRQTSQSIESAGQNAALNAKDLFLPNDSDNQYSWQPISQMPKYSIVPLFFGALKVTLIGLIFAVPIAILAAIYTTTFAKRWLREIIKPVIEILAGFPSVVIGFFCLITFATVLQQIFGNSFRLNAFVGGIGMSLAVIPIIFTVTEDALAAVPKYLKEASLALGASRWQTAFRVTLPAAFPGVFAAIILGFGRAFGETMIALMATGNAALISSDLFESIRTMSATIGAEMAEVEFHSIHYGVLFFIGAFLFVITFSLNAVAEFYVRKKLLKKFQGK